MVEKDVKKQGFSLVEMLIVLAIMGILTTIALPPFFRMVKIKRVEDDASKFQDIIKYAQTLAQKRGDTEIIENKVAMRKVYVAVNKANKNIRIITWSDLNQNNLKEENEFSIVREEKLQNANFGFTADVNKKACSNTSGAPADSVVNFTSNVCPSVGIFDGSLCIRFNGKGFLESMQNAALYFNRDVDNIAISINPLGFTQICKWTGGNWLILR